jgi:hypothetical protein
VGKLAGPLCSNHDRSTKKIVYINKYCENDAAKISSNRCLKGEQNAANKANQASFSS